jgi:hypothetical protein
MWPTEDAGRPSVDALEAVVLDRPPWREILGGRCPRRGHHDRPLVTHDE